MLVFRVWLPRVTYPRYVHFSHRSNAFPLISSSSVTVSCRPSNSAQCCFLYHLSSVEVDDSASSLACHLACHLLQVFDSPDLCNVEVFRFMFFRWVVFFYPISFPFFLSLYRLCILRFVTSISALRFWVP